MTDPTNVATPPITFPSEDSVGTVLRVDTGSVWVVVSDDTALNRASVGTLVAIQSASPSIYLVGMMDRVTRSWGEEDVYDPDVESASPVTVDAERNLLRIVLLGTYSQIGGTSGLFKRGADSYPHLDAQAWVIEGGALQQLMGLLSAGLEPEQQLRLGRFVNDSESVAVADGDRWFQRHAAILGSTGSGKSWAVALMLERASALAHPNLIVLDMHGEYGPLCEPTESGTALAQGFHIAGPTETTAEQASAIYLPWWLLTQEELFSLVLDRSEDNAPNQAARFSHHVRELKEAELTSAGHPEIADRFTIDSPIYCDMTVLLERLSDEDSEMVAGAAGREKQGPFYGKLTRFISRLESKSADRRYSFMFAPEPATKAYGWVAEMATTLLGSTPGIKVIDFSQVPSDVLPIVVGVFARLLYQVQFWMDEADRTPLTLVCDEAHLYLPADDTRVAEQRALDAFERIAKEGRKYGVSLVIVSQRPSDISRTVLSQCNNFMVLRLTNDQDRSVVQRFVPDSLAGLTAALPLLDIGEALVLGDALVLPARLKLDAPQVKPRSATRNFWTEWSTRSPNPNAIAAAVEHMRQQGRQGVNE